MADVRQEHGETAERWRKATASVFGEAWAKCVYEASVQRSLTVSHATGQTEPKPIDLHELRNAPRERDQFNARKQHRQPGELELPLVGENEIEAGEKWHLENAWM